MPEPEISTAGLDGLGLAATLIVLITAVATLLIFIVVLRGSTPSERPAILRALSEALRYWPSVVSLRIPKTSIDSDSTAPRWHSGSGPEGPGSGSEQSEPASMGEPPAGPRHRAT
jgi:hypothetical protein